MGESAERFRLRAGQCRELAAVARDQQARDTLTQMAADLEAEADLLDCKESSNNEHRQGNRPVA